MSRLGINLRNVYHLTLGFLIAAAIFKSLWFLVALMVVIGLGYFGNKREVT